MQCFLALFSSQLFAQGVEKNLPTVIEEVLPSTVTILKLDNNGRPLGHGSGFFITSDGEIATNNHVIEGSTIQELMVRRSDGGTFRVTEILATDQVNDLAIVKVQANKVPFVTLSNSDSVRIGESVFVIGTPAYEFLENTVSSGIVSQHKQIEGAEKIQFTAPISPGSSGGPIFNSKGEVVAIVCSYFPSAGDGRRTQNLNLGVPSNRLTLLMKDRKRLAPKSKPESIKSAAFRQIYDVLDKEIMVEYRAPETFRNALQGITRRVVLLSKSIEKDLNTSLNELGSKRWIDLRAALDATDYRQGKVLLDYFYHSQLSDSLQLLVAYISILCGDKDRGLGSLKSMFARGLTVPDMTPTECAYLWDSGLRSEMKRCLLSSQRLSRDAALTLKFASDEFNVNPDSGIALLERFRSVATDKDVLESLAYHYCRIQNYEKGKAVYQQLIALEPRAALYHRNRGVCCYHLGDVRGAIEELVISSKTSSGHGVSFLTGLMLTKSRPDVALRLLDEDLEAGPAMVVKLASGICFASLGQKDNALRIYEELKKIDPGVAALLFAVLYD
jgi:tetratricopeptide (TPR) repeat protein